MSIGNHGTLEISYAKSARVGPLDNIRMRLLVRCYGLEAEVSRFRHSQSPSGTCKLCATAASDGTATSEVEDTVHFISSCPTLSPVRNCSLPSLGAAASLLVQDPIKFTDVVLGVEWIDDPDLQREFVDFTIVSI